MCVALTLVVAAVVPVAVGQAARDDLDLVSVVSGGQGAAANARSDRAALSADARVVAFASVASNLTADDGDGVEDVFARDVQGATTALVSRASGASGVKANGPSTAPDVSGDGRYVVFESAATNLDAADPDVAGDIFVRDTRSDTTTLVSRAGSGAKANAPSSAPSISDDGRFVSFSSQASNLDAADADASVDVFVRDLVGGTTVLASRASGISGDAGNGASSASRISSNGRWVTFASTSSNLHAADPDTTKDVFARDLQSSVTTLVSRAPGISGAAANGSSDTPDVSGDGRVVTFVSTASNLDLADVDSVTDVFVRDLADDTTMLISRANGDAGVKGDSHALAPRISSDGRTVVFSSRATNLHPLDTDSDDDVFEREIYGGTTSLISRQAAFPGTKGDDDSFAPQIGTNFTHVAFSSNATNLDPPDDPRTDVFVHDVEGRTMQRVSRASGSGIKGRSGGSAVSSDGRYVVFDSQSSGLDPSDRDTASDVFVRDRHATTTTLVSRASGPAGPKGVGPSERPGISDDGRWVVFVSRATGLDPADDDSHDEYNVFVRDMHLQTTALVDRASGVDGAKANDSSGIATISRNGRYVAFSSAATNLVDDGPTGPQFAVYVRDLQTATTALVSRATGVQGAIHGGDAVGISDDGRFVAFVSLEPGLDPDDDDYIPDVFVRDRLLNTTTLVSRASGPTGAKGDDLSDIAALSGDGSTIAFSSFASNLSPDDSDTYKDIFVRDLRTLSTTLVSHRPGEPIGTGHSGGPTISADGRFVAFSSASRLDAADTDNVDDVFVRDLHTAAPILVSRAQGPFGAKGNNVSFVNSISADGRFVSFSSWATNLDPRDDDAISDVFVRDVLGAPPPPPPPQPPPPPPDPPPPPAKPHNAVAPSISGRPVERQRLTCRRGTWQGTAPITYRIRWLRDGKPVGTQTTRRVARADVARRLHCSVTASNAAGSTVAASATVKPRARMVVIRARGTLALPAGAPRSLYPKSRFCRGTMALALLKGSRVLGRHTAPINSRCRWNWTLRVRGTRIAATRRLILKQTFSGNALVRRAQIRRPALLACRRDAAICDLQLKGRLQAPRTARARR